MTTMRSTISLCALCGQELLPGVNLCPYHHGASEERWAAVNRVMCDFFHRGVVPRRLSADEREADLMTHAAEAA